jgi:mRNA interferase HigB
MIVISKSLINVFSAKHPDTEIALPKWYVETREAGWNNFSEIKKPFSSVDFAGNNRYVFNINGNNYPLIPLILFKVRTVLILFMGMHTDYNNMNASQVSYKK